MVQRGDAAHEGAHLLGRKPGAAGLQLHFQPVGHRDPAPHLHRAGRCGAAGRVFRRAGDQLADAIEAQAGIGPAANQEQLLEVRPQVVGTAFLALGPAEQALGDVVADRARRYSGERGELVDRCAKAIKEVLAALASSEQ